MITARGKSALDDKISGIKISVKYKCSKIQIGFQERGACDTTARWPTKSESDFVMIFVSKMTVEFVTNTCTSLMHFAYFDTYLTLDFDSSHAKHACHFNRPLCTSKKKEINGFLTLSVPAFCDA